MQTGGPGVQAQVHREFKASLGYMTPYLKKTKKEAKGLGIYFVITKSKH